MGGKSAFYVWLSFAQQKYVISTLSGASVLTKCDDRRLLVAGFPEAAVLCKNFGVDTSKGLCTNFAKCGNWLGVSEKNIKNILMFVVVLLW
jgi:hypothetical protein